MNLKTVKELNRCYYLLEQRNKNHELDPYISALRSSYIKIKSRWNLFDLLTNLEFSTTFGPAEIHLARNWMDWKTGPLGRTKNLLHEAVHLLQYKESELSPRKIWWLYIRDSEFRDSMEREAEAVADRFFPELRG